MPHLRPATKAQKGSTNETHTAPSAGPRGSALMPPQYGIGFVDGAAEGEGPLQLMLRPDRWSGGQEIAPFLSRDRSPSAPNRTGLPDHLKSGIESLSGIDLSDVNVHFNSSKPALLDARAYTQGTEIHVAPGQERHLPHEAWHVVQQKQGRVQPSFQLKGERINDDENLEREATVIGESATSGHWDGIVQQPSRHNSRFDFSVEDAQDLPRTLARHPSGTRWETNSVAVLQMYKPKSGERKVVTKLRNEYVQLNGGDEEHYGKQFDDFVDNAGDMDSIQEFVSDLRVEKTRKKEPSKKIQKETPVPQVSLPEKLKEEETLTSPSSILPTETTIGIAPSPALSGKKKKKQLSQISPSQNLKEEESPTSPPPILPTQSILDIAPFPVPSASKKKNSQTMSLQEFAATTSNVNKWSTPLPSTMTTPLPSSPLHTASILAPPLTQQLQWITKENLLKKIKLLRSEWKPVGTSTGESGQTLYNFVLKLDGSHSNSVAKAVCDELGHSIEWGWKGEHHYSDAHAQDEGYVNFTSGPMKKRFNCHVYFKK